MKAASAAKRPSAAKTSFDDLLQSNAAWLEWVEAAVKFETLLKDKVPWDQLDGPSKTFISARLKAAAPTPQLLLNSFYLTMVSGFEEYLRSTIREATRLLAISKPKYDDLSEETRRMHVRESARLLRRLDSPPDYLTINIEDLCRGLGSCIPGSPTVALSPEAFADVESLIKLENFISRLEVLDKPISWDLLAKHQLLKDALKLSKEGSRQVAKVLQSELGTMARYRNRIAHVGGTASDVTVQIVSDHRDLLTALSSAIEEVI